MLNVAMTEFEVVDKELSETVQTIKDNDKIGIVNEMGSLDFIEKWKSYREERAEFDSRSFEGGSIKPIIYSESKILTTKWLIKELKSTYKDIFRFEETSKIEVVK